VFFSWHVFSVLSCFVHRTRFSSVYAGVVNDIVSKTGNGADLLIHEATLEDELKAEALAKKHRFCEKDYCLYNNCLFAKLTCDEERFYMQFVKCFRGLALFSVL